MDILGRGVITTRLVSDTVIAADELAKQRYNFSLASEVAGR
jgi:hypothetical protein